MATIKLTDANRRTIAEHGEAACLDALRRNEVVGEGANTVGGGNTRLGDNLINAGRALKARIARPTPNAAFIRACFDIDKALARIQGARDDHFGVDPESDATWGEAANAQRIALKLDELADMVEGTGEYAS